VPRLGSPPTTTVLYCTVLYCTKYAFATASNKGVLTNTTIWLHPSNHGELAGSAPSGCAAPLCQCHVACRHPVCCLTMQIIGNNAARRRKAPLAAAAAQALPDRFLQIPPNGSCKGGFDPKYLSNISQVKSGISTLVITFSIIVPLANCPEKPNWVHWDSRCIHMGHPDWGFVSQTLHHESHATCTLCMQTHLYCLYTPPAGDCLSKSAHMPR
jgi:hypothetical protein